jgi:hypothetical protein
MPDRPFQPMIIFTGKAKSLKGAPLCQALAFLVNIRLNWEKVS